MGCTIKAGEIEPRVENIYNKIDVFDKSSDLSHIDSFEHYCTVGRNEEATCLVSNSI